MRASSLAATRARKRDVQGRGDSWGRSFRKFTNKPPPLATIGRSIRQRVDIKGVNALYVSDDSPLPLPPASFYLFSYRPSPGPPAHELRLDDRASFVVWIRSRDRPVGHYRGTTAAIDALLALVRARRRGQRAGATSTATSMRKASESACAGWASATSTWADPPRLYLVREGGFHREQPRCHMGDAASATKITIGKARRHARTLFHEPRCPALSRRRACGITLGTSAVIRTSKAANP